MFVNACGLNSSDWLWHKTSVLMGAVRTVITLLVLAALFAPFYKSPLENVSMFTTYFTAFFLLRFVLHKLKLDNQKATGHGFLKRTQALDLNELDCEPNICHDTEHDNNTDPYLEMNEL